MMSRIAVSTAAAVVLCAVLWLRHTGGEQQERVAAPAVEHVSFLAVGDVNLGRRVGQVLLRGDTLYPWQAVRDTFMHYDVVFANLESNLSDQNGRTEDPRSNVVFTGPPLAARSLRLAGITVVSTANNHALDFGVDALEQTIVNLDAAGVHHTGTAIEADSLYVPVFIHVKGMTFAFLACTAVMNTQGHRWKKVVADADTAKLLPAVRRARQSADVVVVSCHGGDEYADRPSAQMVALGRAAVKAGADLFLGHHPHVPYGVEAINGRYIVHSLGNFVFRQPGKFWTRLSYGFAADFQRDSTGVHITGVRYLPVACGYQPRFLGQGPEADTVMERIRTLSSSIVTEHKEW